MTCVPLKSGPEEAILKQNYLYRDNGFVTHNSWKTFLPDFLLIENLEEMFPRHYMYSDVFIRFKLSTTYLCAIRLERVNIWSILEWSALFCDFI